MTDEVELETLHTYRISGRPNFPAGGVDIASAGTATIYAVSSFPGITNIGQDIWWTFTAPETGSLFFDVDLSYRADLVVDGSLSPYPWVSLDFYSGPPGATDPGDLTLLESNSSFIGGTSERGGILADVVSGDTYYFAGNVTGANAYVFLRASEYGYEGDWIDTDDIPIISRLPADAGWSAPLPGGYGFPGSNGPEILPNTVARIEAGGEASSYVQPFSAGGRFEGAAQVTHYPQFIEDEGYGLHPWEFPTNWEAIWTRAKAGHWTTSFDYGPDAGMADEFGFDVDGFWDNNHSFVDWPVGYRASSSEIDATPPDGHQTIGYEVWSLHWHIRLSRFLYDWPGHNYVVPWVSNDNLPTDHPEGTGYSLEWNAELGDPPTLSKVEAVSNPRVDAVFKAGDPNDGFVWKVYSKTVRWNGDGGFANGRWFQDADGTDDPVPPGNGGDIYYGPELTAGVPGGETKHGYYGPGMLPFEGGTELASWTADEDDWTTLLEGADVQDHLDYEAPMLSGTGATLVENNVGSLVIAGIPYIVDADTLPDQGFLNAVHDHWSILVFPTLRITYGRPQHRWTREPVPPTALSVDLEVGGVPVATDSRFVARA